LDRALLAGLRRVIIETTSAFDAYDYTGALDITERFFWSFCDDYLETVKERAYGLGDGAASAQAALAIVLKSVLRLLAPIMPYVTEEVWSWWQDGSIHTSSWPTAEEVEVPGDALLLDDLATALAAVRGAKSQAKVSMRTEVSRAEFTGAADVLDRLKEIETDLRAVGRLSGEVQWSAADVPLHVDVELVPADA
jgi:valyl-tRNA synthetase